MLDTIQLMKNDNKKVKGFYASCYKVKLYDSNGFTFTNSSYIYKDILSSLKKENEDYNNVIITIIRKTVMYSYSSTYLYSASENNDNENINLTTSDKEIYIICTYFFDSKRFLSDIMMTFNNYIEYTKIFEIKNDNIESKSLKDFTEKINYVLKSLYTNELIHEHMMNLIYLFDKLEIKVKPELKNIILTDNKIILSSFNITTTPLSKQKILIQNNKLNNLIKFHTTKIIKKTLKEPIKKNI